MKKLLLIFTSSILIFGCAIKKDYNSAVVPEDFYFTIEDGGNDRYNSKVDIFSRQYLDSRSAIKINLSESDKKIIYTIFQGSQFNSMPDFYKPKNHERNIISTPHSTKTIVVNHSGNRKFVSYNTGSTNKKNNRRAKSFLKLYTDIWLIIRNKDAIKNLKESDVDFM